MKKIRSLSILFTLSAALSVAACGNDNGDNGDDGGTNPCNVEANYTSIHDKMLSQPRCATAGCHNTQAKAGGLDFMLGADMVHAAMLDVDSVNANATKPKILVAGNAADSWLYVKVAEAMPPGGRMPLGGALSQCDIDMMKMWIDAGAAK